jgi:hypothetical protein
VSRSCTDNAGNTGSDSASFKYDATNPTITFVGSTPAPNIDGWNKVNLTLTWSCVDTLSGAATPITQGVSSEGTHQARTGTCADGAGNTSSSLNGDVNLDKTAPIVAVTGVTNGATYTLGSVPASGCSTTDALAGVKTAATLTVTGGPVVGSFTAACGGAQDKAGNGNSASATYTVVYNLHGFFQPVDNVGWNGAQAGSAIPVKFDLNGNQGLNIFASGYPKVTLVTCPSVSTPVDTIEEMFAASNSGLQYDSTANPPSGQYIYVWKTDKAWSGTCRRLDVQFIDGQSKSALFQFKK